MEKENFTVVEIFRKQFFENNFHNYKLRNNGDEDNQNKFIYALSDYNLKNDKNNNEFKDNSDETSFNENPEKRFPKINNLNKANLLKNHKINIESNNFNFDTDNLSEGEDNYTLNKNTKSGIYRDHNIKSHLSLTIDEESDSLKDHLNEAFMNDKTIKKDLFNANANKSKANSIYDHNYNRDILNREKNFKNQSQLSIKSFITENENKFVIINSNKNVKLEKSINNFKSMINFTNTLVLISDNESTNLKTIINEVLFSLKDKSIIQSIFYNESFNIIFIVFEDKLFLELFIKTNMMKNSKFDFFYLLMYELINDIDNEFSEFLSIKLSKIEKFDVNNIATNKFEKLKIEISFFENVVFLDSKSNNIHLDEKKQILNGNRLYILNKNNINGKYIDNNTKNENNKNLLCEYEVYKIPYMVSISLVKLISLIFSC